MSDSNEGALIKAFQTMKVMPKPAEVRKKAKDWQKSHPGKAPAELARGLKKETVWRITGAGVVASLPGAIPGLGTATQVAIGGATISGETWFMLRNLTFFQMTVAALHGLNPGDTERQEELLIIWGLVTGLIVPAKEAMKRVGTKVAVRKFNEHVSGELLKRINQKLGATVLTKHGTKRGGVALGRLIPLGVGVLVGGGMNYATAKGFSAQVLSYYNDLRPNDADILVVE